MARPDQAVDLLDLIKRFVVVEAVGTSAVRGQPPKTKATIHEFLAQIDLQELPRSSRESFDTWLDNLTHGLQRKLPSPAKPWGIARKAINLFLRSCLYNHYLREAYGVDQIAHWLEIPLDSVVAKELKRSAPRGALPRWAGLGGLTAEHSKAFQRRASELAAELGFPSRVFLDNYLWLKGR